MKLLSFAADGKEWFGALPPDLSVIARARSSPEGTGSDWLYTYLRAYYRDGTRSTGWNNALFENVGMPHVLWPMQGSRGATIEEVREARDPKTGKSEGFTRTTVTGMARFWSSQTWVMPTFSPTMALLVTLSSFFRFPARRPCRHTDAPHGKSMRSARLVRFDVPCCQGNRTHHFPPEAGCSG